MKIETKFNVGDTFVAIKDGKATRVFSCFYSAHFVVSIYAGASGDI